MGSHRKRRRPGQMGPCNSKPRSSPRFSWLFSLSTSFSALFLTPARIRFHHLLVVTSPLLTSSFQFFDFTASHLQPVSVLVITYCSSTCLSLSFLSMHGYLTLARGPHFVSPSHGFSLLDVVFSPLPFSIFTCIPVEELLRSYKLPQSYFPLSLCLI